ncbi:hypothetical protein KY334_05450 [Candidatus Woesearchaeota archaeon]|nr:hypothetical protein [Candidatus Woesearchaeota archaeon]
MGRKSKVEIENEQLKSELSDLKKMMEKFLSQKSESSEVENKAEDNKSVFEDNIVMNPTQLINITSLFTGGMTLTGSHGKPIRLDRFGVTIPVTFEDLNHVCSNMRSFAEEGYFFIHSEKAIQLLYLQEKYKKIISAKEIENVITLPIEEIEKTYNNVAKNIKQSIIDIAVQGIVNNDPLYSDRNKIDVLSKLYGKDLNIVARNVREYSET